MVGAQAANMMLVQCRSDVPISLACSMWFGNSPDHVIADLTRRDEQVQGAAFVVADGMQLGVHAALGAADQASTPPFFTPMLVAVR